MVTAWPSGFRQHAGSCLGLGRPRANEAWGRPSLDARNYAVQVRRPGLVFERVCIIFVNPRPPQSTTVSRRHGLYSTAHCIAPGERATYSCMAQDDNKTFSHPTHFSIAPGQRVAGWELASSRFPSPWTPLPPIEQPKKCAALVTGEDFF